jgi:cystathionine gamma-synthase
VPQPLCPPDPEQATIVVTAGRPATVADAPLNTPIVPASSFVAGGKLEYAREHGPTTDAFEDALGTLESGHATAFASGMAAANAVLDLIPTGAVVVSHVSTYTGVAARLRELHDAGRITLHVVNAMDRETLLDAADRAHTVWLESPTNPLLEVPDIPAVIATPAQVVVDNTFATPMLQRPLVAGADVVVHSVTKAISGHSDLLMGATVTKDPELAERLHSRRTLLGAVPSAFDAYLALRGLRTLALRVHHAQASARFLVERLRSHPMISRVHYPDFGSIISIEVGEDAADADRLCMNTNLWVFATSLGGVESLLERRRRWPLESTTVPENLVRLSVGIEQATDLWSDLDQALSQR